MDNKIKKLSQKIHERFHLIYYYFPQRHFQVNYKKIESKSSKSSNNLWESLVIKIHRQYYLNEKYDW